MLIVLDAYLWVQGTQSIKNVMRGITLNWLADFPNDRVALVAKQSDIRVLAQEFPGVEVLGTRLWPHGLSAMFRVPWVASRMGADAMLTHNFAPSFGQNRSVLVHDFMFETNPEWFSRKELAYYRWMTRAARRAHVVFSTTETEARRIRVSSRARRVVPVGMGMVDDLISETAESEPDHDLPDGAFILVIGRLNVRKNLLHTLEGARCSGVLSIDNPLVIVGERDGAWAGLPAWVDLLVDEGCVRFTGFIPAKQLRWLIQHCLLYVCLSLDEGFGLPPVEARILGASVLVSDIPVFRENLGDHATYVDPLDPQAIGQAIRDLVEHERHGQDGASEELLARFNWSEVVGRIRREFQYSEDYT